MSRCEPNASLDMQATPQTALTEFADGAVLTLDRPSKLNAITSRMLAEIEACLDDLIHRKARWIVFVGRGDRAFSAGTDVSELQSLTRAQQLEKCTRARNLMVRIYKSPLISVAAINGLAFGAGLELAMACTLRIAAQKATFSLPEIKLGLLPAYAGTQMLPALIGPARALEMMLTGRALSAQEACDIGLIHRIGLPSIPLEEAAIDFARKVTGHSIQAVSAIRDCVAAAGESLTVSGLVAEERNVRAVFGSADAKEGLAAFLEKRAANYRSDRWERDQ